MLQVINRYTASVLYWGTVLSTGAFFLVIMAGVSARYIFRTPILGSVELSRLLFVWACFLAAGIAYRQQAHIAIGFLTDRLSDKLQRMIHTGVYALSLLFLVVLFFASVRVMRALWVSELPMLEISQGWFYVPLPLVCLCMTGYALSFLLEEWKKQ